MRVSLFWCGGNERMEKGLSGDFPPKFLLGNWKWLWQFKMENKFTETGNSYKIW